MRISSRVAATALVVVVLAPSPAPAQSDSAAGSGVSIYAETRLASRYIWRGLDLSRKAASLQPYVELGLPFGLTASAWATSGLDSHLQVDEVDFTLGYSREIGDWELGVGYLHYVSPGTTTEPGADLEDPFASSTSGEVFFTLTRSWESGSAALKYSRGNRAMEGNSVNLRIEQEYATADELWTARPYFQADYLDEFGAPAGFKNRFAMLEIGVPVFRSVGPVQLLAAAHISFVPSPSVRTLNGDAGANRNIAIPWFTFGVVYEP